MSNDGKVETTMTDRPLIEISSGATVINIFTKDFNIEKITELIKEIKPKNVNVIGWEDKD